MLTTKDRMYIAAHRGDSYNYYENTMTAFYKATEAGADMIETDVRLTKDNALIIMHDDTVNRTTNGKGKVSELTYEEILSFNAGDSSTFERVPKFEELISFASGQKITLNIEIKEYYSKENEARVIDCIEQVIELVEKYGMRERVVLNSFDAWVLEYVYKKYGKRYLLHGFYPYFEMMNVTIDPQEYLYCACIFDNEKKEHYDYLIERGIEPWIGASVTQKSKLLLCKSFGARLITTNNPKDIAKKLK